MRIWLHPPRAEREEWIDSHDPSEADFAASFRDVARVNQFLGGTAAALTPLGSLLAHVPRSRPARILDIATGAADIPRAVVRAARRGRFGSPRPIIITAVDNHAKVLAFARRETPAERYPEIQLVEGDAFALNYPDHSFDIVLCSLAFHHFGPERCRRLLREMERLSVHGFIVNDLLRDPLACGLIWALTRLVGANRLTRHDAPLSVLRAYTRREYRDMLRDAGMPENETELRIRPMYRAVITRRKAAPAS